MDELAAWDVFAASFDPADSAWTESAICAQVGGELWFPEVGDSTREAKRLCMACPVRAECEAYVQRRYEQGIHEHGIWAGMSRRQREAKFDRAAGRVSTRNTPLDAEILAMRGKLSQRDIAKRLGVSRRSVERVFQRAKEAA